MGRFWEYCKIAYFNIKSNKIRAFLTMLGIIIGISSVVMIVSLGGGFRKTITGKLNSIAGNYIEIMAFGQDVSFNEEDMHTIAERVDHVQGVVAPIGFRGTLSAYGIKEFSGIVNAGNEWYDLYQKNPIIYGRYFTKEEYDMCENVIVLNKSSAKKMFGTENAVGQTVDVNLYGREKTYRVIGIRDDNEASLEGLLLAANGLESLNVEIPSSTGLNQIGINPDDLRISDVIVILDDATYADDAMMHSVAILEARHDCRGENLIIGLNLNAILDVIGSALSLVTVLIMLVAGISLLVGGIGVMNIMLVSVTERTKEIGIRKALGARTSSILIQFLVESASISLLGGLIGTALGLAGAELICLLVSKIANMTLIADFNVLFILGIAIFSMSIGIFFGILPARKAAKLSPIEALRHK